MNRDTEIKHLKEMVKCFGASSTGNMLRDAILELDFEKRNVGELDLEYIKPSEWLNGIGLNSDPA